MPNIARKRERKRVKKLRRIEKARKAWNRLLNIRAKWPEGMDALMNAAWDPQMSLLYHDIPGEIRD
jgi:hypothetical protein